MKFEDFLKDNRQDLESLEPTEDLWSGINVAIDNKIKEEQKPYSRLKLAAIGLVAIAIICSTIFFVSEHKVQRAEWQIAQLKLERSITEIKGLLAETKTSSRLKAINKVGFIPANDNKQLPEILMQTVKSDPSLPVKFAALNALEDYVELESVRIGLIDILSNSKDDKLKVRMMTFLSEINEGRIEPFINDIMQDDKRYDVWKSEAGQALNKIKKL